MTLLEYLNSMPLSCKKALAVQCKTTLAQLNQVAYGYRKANVFLATDLNIASDKVVTLDSMRPDIDWHDLYKKLKASLESDDFKEAV